MRSCHHVAQAAFFVQVFVSAAVKINQKGILLNVSCNNIIKSKHYLGRVPLVLLRVENLTVFPVEDEHLHNTPIWNVKTLHRFRLIRLESTPYIAISYKLVLQMRRTKTKASCADNMLLFEIAGKTRVTLDFKAMILLRCFSAG